MSQRRPTVAFAIHQSGMRANGGVESITQIITRLTSVLPVVLTNRDTAVTHRWRDLGLTVHEIGADLRFELKAARYGLGNLLAAKILREIGASAVHCNDIRSFWNVGVAARILNLPTVLNVRDVKPVEESYGLHWRLAASLADCTLSLSADMCERLARRILPVRGMSTCHEYIPSIVDPATLCRSDGDKRSLRERLGLPTNAFLAVYVAAVCKKKAQLRFLDALAQHANHVIPKLHVVFVGDYNPDTDVYSAQCRDLVHGHRLHDRVSFVGYRSDACDYFAAADVSVLASEREGLARCMIESIACGTPMVSFDVPSAHEILTRGDAGRVVAHGDYAALLSCIAALAADPHLTARLGENGVALANRLFGPERVISEHERLYARLIRPRRPGIVHRVRHTRERRA